MKQFFNQASATVIAGLLMTGAAHAQATGFAAQNGGTTGGQGGQTVRATTGTEIHAALCSRAASDTPIIIEVEGTINHGNTSKVSGDSCNTADDKIEIKDVSNITLIGVGSGATFDQLGIHLRNAENVIIRNVTVQNVKKSGSPTSNGGDAIGMETDVSNVWVDHVTLIASGGESDGYDGLFDIKDDTTFVTLSYSILQGSDRGGLVGSSSGDLSNGPITWHHNIFRDLNSRVPLLRGGFGHLYNNWYDGIESTGINARVGGRALIENNYFEDSQDVIGTFFTDEPGFWEVSGNIFDNVTWSAPDNEYAPAGPNVQSTANLSVPYSVNLDDAGCLPTLLEQIAGANKGLQVSDGTCVATGGGGSTGGGGTGGSGGDDGGGSSGGGSTGGEPGETIRLDEGSVTNLQGSVDNNNGGFTGSGFINTDNTATSGFEWIVNSPYAGDATVTARFANGTTTNRTMTVSVNGQAGPTVDFNGTGAWTTWTETSFTLSGLQPGNNTIRFDSAQGSGGPNFDWVDVTLPGAPASGGGSGGSGGDDGGDDGGSTGGGGTVDNGTNLSIGAGADGSSKGSGTSYGNVNDGDVSSVWSPSGTTGRVSVKWSSDVTINTVQIREAPGTAGTVGAWQLVNNDNGDVLASGNGISGPITFSEVSLSKVNFVIDSASGTPQIGEFETYNATQTSGGGSTGGGSTGGGDDGGSDGGGSTGGGSTGGGSTGGGSTGGGTTETWTFCANENQTCTVPSESIVRYGANGQYFQQTVTGSISCSNAVFGDPIQGTFKTCEYQPVSGGGSTGGGSTGGGGTGGGTVGGGGSDVALNSSGLPTSACIDLVTNDSVNWNETTLANEQEIVTCLAATLGRPVGYGEDATGGFDPSGGSDLVVITTGGSQTPEQQIAAAVDRDDPVWIVFDKDDFAAETEVAMYRNQCGDSSVLSALGGASIAQCYDYRAWCSANGISSQSCAAEFFNDRLNDQGLPIRNVVVGANTTIDGRGANAKFLFNGFAVGSDSSGAPTRTSDNVIFTHLTFEGAGHIEDHGLDPDMLRVTGASEDVWIHKNSFLRTGDAAFDVKVGAFDITMSFNRLVDVKRASLHGSSDSRTINEAITTTMHNNMFITTDAFYDEGRSTLRRIPLIRRGSSHQFNNVFVDYWKDIASVRVGATLLWEDNLFVGLDEVKAERSDLAEGVLRWAQELTLDTIREGDFTVTGSYAQFANGNCILDPGYRTEVGEGENNGARYLPNDYSSASRQTISSFSLNADQALLDYVNITAGADGATPYTSPLGQSISQTIAGTKPNCKQ